jgi:X-X-X-Leu-X-X-Gly heptad repeat protein
MNKTLLLILCDFLLLNLLALTRWEKAEPPRPRQPPVPELSANAVTKDQDLVETMRQSLADEQMQRDELAKKLATADEALAAREQSLTQLQSDRVRLAQEKEAAATALASTQKTADALQKKVANAAEEATMTKEQLAQLQRALAEKQAEAERQRLALAALEKAHADARKQIEGLTMAVVVAEQEKKNLRETADALKTQVQAERTERIKVQEATTQLAQGVGQLAEKSGELTKEIRENRPINANVLFNDFQANRVTANFAVSRKGLFGQSNREKQANTVLVTDGRKVYAITHIADTPFSVNENGSDWEKMTIGLAHDGGSRESASAMTFLAHDPRVVALPLTMEQAAALGAKVYPLAADPFKFPEAVLIDGSGHGYGEVGFKLDPAQPGFVRVDNRLFKRLFGDFAPKRGDLVFSKTGEFLGLMVNNDYCAVVKDFGAFKTITPGPDIKEQATGATLNAIVARVRSLPLQLQ